MDEHTVLCPTNRYHAPAVVTVNRQWPEGVDQPDQAYCWEHLIEMMTTFFGKGESITITKVVDIDEGLRLRRIHA